MKIDKYKYLKDSKYEVIINNKKYTIYEDIILKNELLLKKEISKRELDLLLEENSFYEAYYKSIKYINLKLRTKKEIEDYLKRNEFDKKTISSVITRLEEEKYLDDDIYSKAYIHDQIVLKLVGPNKIKKDLIKLKIKEDIIDKNIIIYTKDIELEKLEKLISKAINTNKNKSSYMLKNKILTDMINRGFTKEYIEEILNNKSIDDADIYQKEYDKLYNKLSKKYQDKELEYKIKQKLYQKGFKQN